MITAIFSEAHCLKQLAQFYQQMSLNVFFVRDRIFIFQKSGIVPPSQTQIISDALQLGILDLHVGLGTNAALSLMHSVHGAIPLADCPVSFLFKFISPFCDDELGGDVELEIMAWLQTKQIKTFQDFRAQIRLGLPKALVFLGERFSEADVLEASPSTPLENFVNSIEKRIGARSVFSAHSNAVLRFPASVERAAIRPHSRPGAFLSVNEWSPSATPPHTPNVALQAPSRLLPVPSPLTHFANRLVGAGKQWTCEQWSKPERMETTTENKTVERDYFRVKTKEGDDLWIFRDVFNGQLYWHGLFD